MMLFAALTRRIISTGRLAIIDASGARHEIVGHHDGPEAVIRLHDRRLNTLLALRPRLALGEAYMDGRLTLEEGTTLYDLLELFGQNLHNFDRLPSQRGLEAIEMLMRPLLQFNPMGAARRHVAHHYDLSGELYRLFLDSDRQYSCAYFATDNDDLEIAQANKKRHIASKLLLAPGQRVLDIGCGWGGLALYLARTCDVEVTGLTLSEEQHREASRRAAEAGLADRVRFHLRDYREETDTYDRIVSVGMFEHVGVNHYPAFFGKVQSLLTDDGVALLHSIGRQSPPGCTNPWLRKYIFPGGYSPALSEVLRVIERTALWVTDIEILRLHYARTLRAWRERFARNRDRIAELYDERFCRMWEFYLTGCEASFRWWDQSVFQMQIARSIDTVPLTRDYMYDWERSHT